MGVYEALTGFISFILTYYLPAMVANASPVFIKKGTPMDAGKRFVDGKRLLGDGKTWEGLFNGLFFGYTIAVIEALVLADARLVVLGLASAAGALIGDVVSSFFKRRLGLERGAPLFLVDQLDFYVGSTIAMMALGWRPQNWGYVLAGAVVIVVIHKTANYLAYLLKLKDVPW